MPTPPFSCPVRGCWRPLERQGSSYACVEGHTFDIARRGYVNLLQPQDRRSIEAGDAKAAVAARASLIAAGAGRAVIDAVIAEVVTALGPGGGAVAVELGSGTGDLLGHLADTAPVTAIGLDLSRHAAEHAARRFPRVTWAVANADRRLPLLDQSVRVVVSVHARRNPGESRRVLTADGCLVVAVPAADDLIELREAVLGRPDERDRLAALVAEHEAHFRLVRQRQVRTRVPLDHDQVLALLRSTYRGLRLRESARAEQIGRLEVTFASDIAVLAPRGTGHDAPAGQYIV